jgi:hypothetical protein
VNLIGGRTGRGRRLRSPFAALAAVAAWFAIAAVFAPVRATGYGPVVECPATTATLQTLISMGTYLDGPLANRYGEPALNEGALGCLGDTEVTFIAFRSEPEGLGGAYAYQVEPAWLDTWHGARWFLAPTDAEIAPGFGAGPFLAVAVPPPLQARFEELAGQWVSVRGHFDDATAAGCRLMGNPKPKAGEIPTKADLHRMCATSSVVAGIDPVATPCPTGTIDWAAISTTPEPMRAKCFGRADLSFEAVGYSINNTWHLAVPEVKDWELLDPAGVSDTATDRAKALEAFVPLSLSIPSPSDAPWANRDGIGGPDVRWHVVGHFDDPGAAACRPAPDGFVLGDRTVGWSEDDARDFCRNHLFVDSLEWIRDGAPSASPAGAPADQPSPSSVGLGRPDAPLEQAPASGPVVAVLGAVAAVAIGLALRAALIRRRRA